MESLVPVEFSMALQINFLTFYFNPICQRKIRYVRAINNSFLNSSNALCWAVSFLSKGERYSLYLSLRIKLKPSVMTKIQPGKLAYLLFSNYSCYRPSLHKARKELKIGKLKPLKEKNRFARIHWVRKVPKSILLKRSYSLDKRKYLARQCAP